MKYRGLYLLKLEDHSVRKCCELFQVSPSGFYDWLKRGPSNRVLRDQDLKAKIKTSFDKSSGRYGSPRIQKELVSQGEVVSRTKVASLMSSEGLRAKGKKPFRPKTTLNNSSDKKSARVFKIEDHQVQKENEVWVSDLTYIATRQGFCYLTVVLDLCNREIKGRDLSVTMHASKTKNALLEAVKLTPGSLEGVIFHSDQGVQYCSSEVRDKLKVLKMTQSMSRKGNCYDNAFAESFFHSLKTELDYHVFDSFEQARKEVFEYIDWYNNERLHSSLGYMSPRKYSELNRSVA